MRMKKVSLYVLTIVISAGVISCAKSGDDDDSDLVGNWIASSDFDGNARSEAVSFTIGAKTYLATGTTNTTRFSDLWEYDNKLKYWTQKASLSGNARSSAVAFSAQGKGYVGTGYDGTYYLNDFWQYDPAANKWTKKENFGGSARYDAVAFSLNNKGYICSGFDGNYLKDLWEYDPSLDKWTQKASLGGSKRSAAMSFILNGKAYIVSGNNNGSALNDLWLYDPSTDTWTQKRRISNVSDDSYDDDYTTIVRFNGVAFVMGSRAYIASGENGSMVNSTWEYDDTNDLWAEKTSFEGSPRTGAAAFTLEDKGFVLTGRNGSLSYDNMYEFHPGEDYNKND
jgi:N-acetylneuraminic acid mutarotase